MNTFCFITLCVLGVVSAKSTLRYNAEDAIDLFEKFITTHNKQYEHEEERALRYEIFRENLKKINNLNEQSEHAEFGLTKFSDLTKEEFLKKYTGYKNVNYTSPCTMLSDKKELNKVAIDAPDAFDWRDKGVVSEVKNQGQCGSCWAFSTTGNVESAYMIKTGQKVSLSEQQLVDCDTASEGCNGGFPSVAIRYLQGSGAMSETDYPYEAQGDTCRYDANKAKISVAGCMMIDGQEAELMNNLYTTGPLSILLDADAVQHYTGGIIADSLCQGTAVNHAVLLVGYGYAQKPYWIIKNSWGAEWGEQGYFRIERGVNCLLFINTPPVTATI